MKFYKLCNWMKVLQIAQKKCHLRPEHFCDIKCRDARAWRKFWKIAQSFGFGIGDFVYCCIHTHNSVIVGQMIGEMTIDPGCYFFPENTVQIVPVFDSINVGSEEEYE